MKSNLVWSLGVVLLLPTSNIGSDMTWKLPQKVWELRVHRPFWPADQTCIQSNVDSLIDSWYTRFQTTQFGRIGEVAATTVDLKFKTIISLSKSYWTFSIVYQKPLFQFTNSLPLRLLLLRLLQPWRHFPFRLWPECQKWNRRAQRGIESIRSERPNRDRRGRLSLLPSSLVWCAGARGLRSRAVR
jgi:hypothetical protein